MSLAANTTYYLTGGKSNGYAAGMNTAVAISNRSSQN